jgi:hypothetical protein
LAAAVLAALTAAEAATLATARGTATAACGAAGRSRFAGEQTFTLQFLAGQLAGATDRLGFFSRALLGGLLEMSAELHLAENAFTLKLFLKRLKRLIDIVVANENLQAVVSSI